MAHDPLAYFKHLLAQSELTAVFTGAGISTESGIPDFRSPGGIWTKNKPINFQDFVSSEDVRRESWQRKIETDKTMSVAQPNNGHMAIANLVNTGQIRHVITQNIDGMHQASGVPDNQVIELHGNATYAGCLECEKRYELDPIKTSFASAGTLPICDDCGGIIKTATISFGQAMPQEAMNRAKAATLDCDLFISIGSSLVVYPAAGFPLLARESGANLVILNRDTTDLDNAADLVINAEIGPTLSGLVAFN